MIGSRLGFWYVYWGTIYIKTIYQGFLIRDMEIPILVFGLLLWPNHFIVLNYVVLAKENTQPNNQTTKQKTHEKTNQHQHWCFIENRLYHSLELNDINLWWIKAVLRKWLILAFCFFPWSTSLKPQRGHVSLIFHCWHHNLLWIHIQL